MNALSTWFAGLSERDRRVVTIGGAVAAVLVVLAVLLPLHRGVAQAHDRVERKRTDLAWMQSVAPEIVTAGPVAAAPAGQESLVVLIDRSARESGLGTSLTSSEPIADSGLRVRLEKASFDSIVAWLARLSDQQGVRVESATVDGAGGDGLVNASLVVRSR